jgi:hypothetical protein
LRFFRRRAAPSRGENRLDAEDVAPGGAVFCAAWTCRILGDVAAQLAAFAARRVGGIEQPDRLDGVLQIGGNDAGLGDSDQVALVDLEDAVHPFEAQDDATSHRQGAAGEPRARAARRHRDAVLEGEAQDGLYLIGGGR